MTAGSPEGPHLNVHIIAALTDNYIYLLEYDQKAIVIDPSTAAPVLKQLRKRNLELSHILLTHHHIDHTGGCRQLRSSTNCKILGPIETEAQHPDQIVHDGDRIQIDQLTLEVIGTPGHTTDHVCWYLPEADMLFSGDTLFTCGCGRIIGADASRMWKSMQKLMQLPTNTLIFCGHEYTLENIEFALTIDSHNQDLQEQHARAKQAVDENLPCVPTALDVELKTNPFMRCDDTAIKQQLNMPLASAESVFAEVRKLKDCF